MPAASARRERVGPSELAEDGPDLTSHLARAVSDIGGAVPERRLARQQRLVVAPHVAEAAHADVSETAVQLDDQTVVLVDHVSPVGQTGPILPVSLGQAVGTFDVAQVPQLQR